MDYGVLIPPLADSWQMAKRAEELGFSRAWFFDTQLLNSDLFVIMGAAAMHTSKIRLGTGVLVPSNRIAPVAACGLATLNALAPGRIDFGISTGFTARRTMGLGPVRLSTMAEYIRTVQGLLAGDTVDAAVEGKRHKVRFLDPDIGAINIKDPIPLHLSAFGPKARRLTAELGAGWMGSGNNLGHAKAGLAEMQAAWHDAGKAEADLYTTATMSGVVLHDGEGYDSPRVIAQAGPNVTIGLHSIVEREQFGEFGRPIPPHLAPLVERYRETYLSYEPADARYLSNHRGHLMYLRDDERANVTPDLIKAMTCTATKSELRDHIRELAHLGFNHMTINCGYRRENVLEDWVEVFEGV